MIRENRKQSALPCFFLLRDEFDFHCENCCFIPVSVFSVVAQSVTQMHCFTYYILQNFCCTLQLEQIIVRTWQQNVLGVNESCRYIQTVCKTVPNYQWPPHDSEWNRAWCPSTSWTFSVLLDVLSVNHVKDMAVLSFRFKNISLLISESN